MTNDLIGTRVTLKQDAEGETQGTEMVIRAMSPKSGQLLCQTPRFDLVWFHPGQVQIVPL